MVTIREGWCETPIGKVVVGYHAAGIVSVDRFGEVPGTVDELPAELAAVFDRRLATGDDRDLQLDLSACTELERDVLTAVAAVPFGEVITYAELAAAAGRARAVRACASAVGRNPIPLLIPCHRVVRSDGTIGEFGWPVEIKRALLVAEGVELRGDRWRLGSRHGGMSTRGTAR